MKVVNLICGSFAPERTAGANRMVVIAKELAKTSKVNVIFLVKAGEKFIHADVPEDIINNENICLFPAEIQAFTKSNFLKRVISEIGHANKLMSIAKANKCDVQIVSIPFLMLLPVSALTNIFGKRQKNILEVRDLIWRYFEFKKGFVNQMLYQTLKGMSQFSLKGFDKIITVTETQKQDIDSICNVPSVCIPNGIDRSAFERFSHFSVKDVGDTTRIIYAGSIGYPQNLQVLLDAVKILNERDLPVQLDILGHGPEKDKLSQSARDMGLKNVEFHGSVSFESLLSFYERSDVLYAQLRDIPSLKTAEPTKIFEYASTGRRVVFGALGPARDILSKFSGVKVIQPDSPEEIVDAISQIRNLPIDFVKNQSILKAEYIREDIIRRYQDEI